jgi:hypothetical protein
MKVCILILCLVIYAFAITSCTQNCNCIITKNGVQIGTKQTKKQSVSLNQSSCSSMNSIEVDGTDTTITVCN